MLAMAGGKGPAIQGGPGYSRSGPAPYREEGSREPLEAIEVLLKAGANPNVKAPDGATLLHQAVQAQQVAMIRALVDAGASLDAVNKKNQTPLLLAESLKKPAPAPGPLATGTGAPAPVRAKRDTPEDVIAVLRELMHLGADDPAPQPPPLPAEKSNDDKEKKTEADAQ
jgi:hypothetical protein